MAYWSTYAEDDFVGWPPRPPTDRYQRRRRPQRPRRLGRIDVDRDAPQRDAGWGTRMIAAFYAGGWSKALTPLERSVWFAMVSLADPVTGKCSVSLSGLAKLLRMAKESRLSKARRRLVDCTLLIEVSSGGGPGRAKQVWMTTPWDLDAARAAWVAAGSPGATEAQPGPRQDLPAIEDHDGHLWGPRP